MKKRWVAAVVTIVAVVVILAGLRAYRTARLREVKHHIERTYAPLLALIEDRATNPPSQSADMLEDFKRRGQILDEIDSKMTAPEFHEASWSSDGHHGLESLRRRADWTGHSTNRRWWSIKVDGDRAVMAGETFEGSPLYVYEAWLPRGTRDGKRQFEIAFDKKIIDAAMLRGADSGR